MNLKMSMDIDVDMNMVRTRACSGTDNQGFGFQQFNLISDIMLNSALFSLIQRFRYQAQSEKFITDSGLNAHLCWMYTMLLDAHE
jgi:hypothetical protein